MSGTPHAWRRITHVALAGLPETLAQTVDYCPRCGTVRLAVEQHGERVVAPDYWRVGGDGQPEFHAPPCRPPAPAEG